jgi:hypothetical protein
VSGGKRSDLNLDQYSWLRREAAISSTVCLRQVTPQTNVRRIRLSAMGRTDPRNHSQDQHAPICMRFAKVRAYATDGRLSFACCRRSMRFTTTVMSRLCRAPVARPRHHVAAGTLQLARPFYAAGRCAATIRRRSPFTRRAEGVLYRERSVRKRSAVFDGFGSWQPDRSER